MSARFGVYRVFNCVSREFFLRTVYSGNIGDQATEYENAEIAQKNPQVMRAHTAKFLTRCCL